MVLIIRNGRIFSSVKSVAKHLNVRRATVISFVKSCLQSPELAQNWQVLRGEDVKDLDKISEAIHKTSHQDIERFRKHLNALQGIQPKTIQDRDAALANYAKYAKALGVLEREVAAGQNFVKQLRLVEFKKDVLENNLTGLA